jgi:phosphate starvation-inducible PhoH-like protein
MQQVLDVSNEVAVELAGVEDGVLDALRERLDCTIALRGNRLTLAGDDGHVTAARAVLDELVELVEGGHQIGPDTVGAVLNALDQADDLRDVLDDIVWRHRGKNITPKTEPALCRCDQARTVTFGIGPAEQAGRTWPGTGGLGTSEARWAVSSSRARRWRRRAARLPSGDMLAKSTRTCALYDALTTRSTRSAWPYMERGTIEVAPLAFMRGRTLNDSFIVLDEAQNTTPEQMQMFLTRLGFGSKMVVTGDITQIDLPREQASGLIQVREILAGIDAIAFLEFGNEDVVRHKLVQRIVEAYKRHAEETGTARRR